MTAWLLVQLTDPPLISRPGRWLRAQFFPPFANALPPFVNFWQSSHILQNGYTHDKKAVLSQRWPRDADTYLPLSCACASSFVVHRWFGVSRANTVSLRAADSWVGFYGVSWPLDRLELDLDKKIALATSLGVSVTSDVMWLWMLFNSKKRHIFVN